MRQLFVAALLVFTCSGVAPSRSQPQNNPWQIYMDAAADANLAEDFVSAEALLKIALATAEQSEPNGGRPMITKLALQLTSAHVGQKEVDRQYGMNWRLDDSLLDPSFLPFAQTLDRLASKYFDRFNALNNLPDTQENREKRTIRLGIADRYLLLKWAIQNRWLPKDDPALALTLGFHGLIIEKQGKFNEAIEKYEAALKIWESIERRKQQLKSGSGAHQLFGEARSGVGDADNPIEVTVLLGRALMWTAEDYANAKQHAEAAAAFTRAEALFLQVSRLYEESWPNHPRAAASHRFLGQLYVHQQRWDEALGRYGKALAIFEHNLMFRDARTVAERMVKILRDLGRHSETSELEIRYGFKR